MNFHPDVLAAHAQFGGDLESMQALYDRPDHVAEIARLQEREEAVTREKERFAELYGREAAAHMAYREAAEAERGRLRVLLEQARTALGQRFPKLSARIDAALQKDPQP